MTKAQAKALEKYEDVASDETLVTDRAGDDGMTQRERAVYFGLRGGLTLAEIAGDLGISKQRVSQIRDQLIEKGHDLEKRKYTKRTEGS